MKKGLFIAAVLFTAFGSNAQEFAIKGGATFSKIRFNKQAKETFYEDELDGFKMLAGASIAGTFEYSFGSLFSLQTGLGLSSKGIRYAYADEYSYGDYQENYKVSYGMRNIYVQSPLNAKFSFKVGENSKLYTSVGGYIGVGTFGIASFKESIDVVDGDDSYRDTYNESDFYTIDDSGVDMVDFGATVAAGFQYKKMLFEVNYEHGLSNIQGGIRDSYRMNNSTIGFSIGYVFGKK